MLATLGLVALGADSARASFHLMQIQQVIGGVCGGDKAQQAIQLRMRSAGQNEVAGASLVVRDATGQNPITLLTFPTNAPTGNLGSRILVASPKFAERQGPPADFLMTNLIPGSYMAAGRLTFEKDGTVYWSVAWGGSNYTGSHAGSTDNDDDGNFGPAFEGSLPSSGVHALVVHLLPLANLHTTNAAKYFIPPVASIFSNNDDVTGSYITCEVFRDSFETAIPLVWTNSYPKQP